MANIWKNTVITAKGAALQAKAMAGGKIEVTSVRAGAGVVPVDELVNQTGISDIRQEATLRQPQTHDNTAILPVYLTNEGVYAAYELTQIGIYAADPDEGEILYAIGQCETPKHIPAVTEMPYSLTWNFHFTLASGLEMTVTLHPAGYVTDCEFEKHVKEFETQIANFKAQIEALQKSLDDLSQGYSGGFEEHINDQGYFHGSSFVTSETGVKYKFGKDEYGLYLDVFDGEEPEIVLFELGDDMDAEFYAEIDGDLKSIDNAVDSDEELTDDNYCIEVSE